MDEQNNNPQPPYEQPPQQQYQQPPYGQPPYGQPQQPYQQPPQQPVPQAGARPATEGEKNGLFSVAGGVMMLVLTIIATVNLALALFSNLPLSIFSNVLPILTVVGLWLCYVNAKKQKLNKVGPTLIRIPFIISFIGTVIVYGLVILVCFMGIGTAAAMSGMENANAAAAAAENETVSASGSIGMSIIGIIVAVMLFVIVAFVLEILYFKSINNCLKNSVAINQGYGINKPSGTFAAVISIIKAVIGFIPGAALAFISIGGGALIDSLVGSLGENMEMLSPLFDMLKGFGAFSLVSSIVSLAYGIMSGIMILQFCKKTQVG